MLLLANDNASLFTMYKTHGSVLTFTLHATPLTDG